MNKGQMTREDRSELFHYRRHGHWEFTRGLRAVRELLCHMCGSAIEPGAHVTMFGNPRRPHCTGCLPLHRPGERLADCVLCDEDARYAVACPTCGGTGRVPASETSP